MSLSLIELQCNWRSIQNLRKNKEVSFPGVATLIESGVPICEEKTSVFLSYARLCEIDIAEMRDWAAEFVKDKFKMFHRFQYETLPYRIEREYLGLTARFEKVDDALYYKMYWF